MSSIGKNEENTNESSIYEDEFKNNDHNMTSNSICDSYISEEITNQDFEILPESIAEPDHIYKIIIIGDSGVGKSCLANRIISGKFNDNNGPTLGYEFFPFLVKYKEKVLKLELWDTCGQEHFRSLIKSFYINSSMAIIVYSIDDKKTFDSIPEWIRQCRDICSPNTKYILIGNKKDLKM